VRSRLSFFAAAAAVAALTVAGAAMAAPGADSFDRADGPIGGSWTVQSGSFAISSNAAVGSDLGLATLDGASGSVVEADLAYVGPGLQYAGVVLDHLDAGNNIFVKLQGTGSFTNIACYYGNNGSGWAGGPGFFGLDAPMTSAHIAVTIEADRDVQIELSAIDGGSGTQSYTCAGAPATGGTGVGIVGFAGAATVDNFVAGDPDTTAPTVTCDASPTFTVGESGEVTATVTDAGSGPESDTVSAPADTATAGSKSVELTGRDLAGNETTVSCDYVVEAAAASTTSSTTSPSTSTTAPTTPTTAPRAQAVTAQPTFTG
jgi:hypothetical protein